jgi:hypothetical protein
MAMAKNLAEHGVWGVTQHGFTSSSSSPLWTLLLALVYLVFGVSEVAPLAMNIVFASAVCVLIYLLSRRAGMRTGWALVALLAVQVLTPLVALVFCGQEHTLHLLLTIAFAWFAAQTLADDRPPGRGFLPALALAPLLVAARYEGLFLVGAAVLMLFLRRRPVPALVLAGAGLLPVVVYGVVSVSNGWMFLPNPIMIKGNLPHAGSLFNVARFLGWAFYQLARKPHVLILLLGGSGLVFWTAGRGVSAWRYPLVSLFVIAGFMHMQFSRTAAFSRYEGYLVGLGIFAIIVTLVRVWPELGKETVRTPARSLALAAAITLALAPLAASTYYDLSGIPPASKSIYEQQLQMARFIREFYQGQTVALNDIGAVSFLADIRCVDIWGIANTETGRALAQKRRPSGLIADVCRRNGAAIAVVYEEWLNREAGGVPGQWAKAGDWTLPDNAICGDETVSFYAVDSSGYDRLVNSLRAFASQLPHGVIQSGPYVAAR